MSPISSYGRRAAAILLTAAAAVLLVSAPAQAAIPSGSGWSTSWRYYSSTTFEFGATLPGVTAAGSGIDNAGDRGALVTVTDTADDYRCARVVMSVPGWGTLGQGTVCDQGESVTVGNYNAKVDGYIYVMIYRTYVFGEGYDKMTTLVIPPSKDDPTLRSVNTGASWKYTSGTQFTYSVRRPNVYVGGNGEHVGNSRSAFSAVQKQVDDLFVCATGKTSGPGATASAKACGAKNSIEVFNEDSFTNGIMVEACYVPAWSPKRCLSTTVSKPV
jgi:hypothetical protein